MTDRSEVGDALDAERFCQNWIVPVPSGLVGSLRARDRARDRQIIEAACRAVCRWCDGGVRSGPAPYENATVHRAQRINSEWRHSLIWKSGGEGTLACAGSKIREALKALLSEGEERT